MKKALCVVVFVFLAAQVPLWSYDQTPSSWQVLPEAVWAAATGGGTWVTEAIITNFSSSESSQINCYFHYNGGSSANITLPYTLGQYESLKSINILYTMDYYDSSSLAYYQKAGAVWFWTESTSALAVQAKTVNGNYGKTLPALSVVAANSVAQGRRMVIQDLVQNSTYRTNCGFFNSSSLTTYTLWCVILSQSGTTVGSAFPISLPPYHFVSFNPFAQAGVPSETYSNCMLYIYATVGGSDVRGVMCYGSLANNSTNDTYALIARPID